MLITKNGIYFILFVVFGVFHQYGTHNPIQVYVLNELSSSQSETEVHSKKVQILLQIQFIFLLYSSMFCWLLKRKLILLFWYISPDTFVTFMTTSTKNKSINQFFIVNCAAKPKIYSHTLPVKSFWSVRFLMFLKKFLLLTKPAFIWSKIQQK